MGHLIVDQIVSADGFAAREDGRIDWFDDDRVAADAEVEELELLARVDAIVLGARTYRLFAAYWPTVDPRQQRIAEPLNRLPKHVFSTRLSEAPWGRHTPATLERGDLIEGIARLRQQYSGDLLVPGSLSLCEALFRARVVDRLRLRVLPIVLGAGRRFTPAVLDERPMTLKSSRRNPRGQVSMTYALARATAGRSPG
jgi:dihydrofolate reductase